MSECDMRSKLIQKSLELAEDKISTVKFADKEAFTINNKLCDRGIKELIWHVDANRVAQLTSDKKLKRTAS